MKKCSVPVPKKFNIPELEKVNDYNLEKDISNMIYRLFNNNEKAASKIVFGIFNGMIPIGALQMDQVGHFIFINTKAKEMLKNEEGKEIIYAVLAHEIGHIVDIRKNNYCYTDSLNKHHGNDPLELRIRSEVKADEIALVLLEKIYSNPKEILSKQICFVINNMLSYKDSTLEELNLAKIICAERSEALAY